jgi:hypothetical protein
MGGSQINAIELAAAMRRRGHNVTIAASDGVLSSMIRRLGLDYVPISRAPCAPSVATDRFSLESKADRLVEIYQQTVSQEQPLGKRLRSMGRTLKWQSFGQRWNGSLWDVPARTNQHE